MTGYSGWQLAAARAAAALSYRDVAAETGISLSRLVELEKLEVIELQETAGPKSAGGMLVGTFDRLVECFGKHGIELRAAMAGRPAAVVCADQERLLKRRRSEFRNRRRARATGE